MVKAIHIHSETGKDYVLILNRSETCVIFRRESSFLNSSKNQNFDIRDRHIELMPKEKANIAINFAIGDPENPIEDFYSLWSEDKV